MMEAEKRGDLETEKILLDRLLYLHNRRDSREDSKKLRGKIGKRLKKLFSYAKDLY